MPIPEPTTLAWDIAIGLYQIKTVEAVAKKKKKKVGVNTYLLLHVK